MNVFIIPSWYPSEDYPLNGIFIQEQTYYTSIYAPYINFGVSLWGQKDKQTLLWLQDHLWNVRKILASNLKPSKSNLYPNLVTYTTPTLIWSRKVLNGNIKGIINANIKNFKHFEKEYGQVDLVHAHVGYPAGHIALELNKVFNIPYIITEHMIPFPSYYDTDRKGNLTAYYKEPYMQAAINIAVGESLRAKMTSIGLPRVITLPNFIDECFFKPLSNSLKSTRSHSFTFFTLCEIIPRKGINVLLHAIKVLSQEDARVNFRIGGIGSNIEEYKAIAKKLGIERYVEWLGLLTREEARNEHQQASAFVLSSQDESMGIVYIEALACGKPIIATRCGGPEAIVNEMNGLLVEKNNPQELANAMIRMIKHYNQYDSQAIRQDFLNRFSKKAVIPQLISLYQKVISQHNSTP
jgi:glycosyltransferase involved in cell wall biosynthesis